MGSWQEDCIKLTDINHETHMSELAFCPACLLDNPYFRPTEPEEAVPDKTAVQSLSSPPPPPPYNHSIARPVASSSKGKTHMVTPASLAIQTAKRMSGLNNRSNAGSVPVTHRIASGSGHGHKEGKADKAGQPEKIHIQLQVWQQWFTKVADNPCETCEPVTFLDSKLVGFKVVDYDPDADLLLFVLSRLRKDPPWKFPIRMPGFSEVVLLQSSPSSHGAKSRPLTMINDPDLEQSGLTVKLKVLESIYGRAKPPAHANMIILIRQEREEEPDTTQTEEADETTPIATQDTAEPPSSQGHSVICLGSSIEPEDDELKALTKEMKEQKKKMRKTVEELEDKLWESEDKVLLLEEDNKKLNRHVNLLGKKLEDVRGDLKASDAVNQDTATTVAEGWIVEDALKADLKEAHKEITRLNVKLAQTQHSLQQLQGHAKQQDTPESPLNEPRSADQQLIFEDWMTGMSSPGTAPGPDEDTAACPAPLPGPDEDAIASGVEENESTPQQATPVPTTAKTSLGKRGRQRAVSTVVQEDQGQTGMTLRSRQKKTKTISKDVTSRKSSK